MAIHALLPDNDMQLQLDQYKQQGCSLDEWDNPFFGELYPFYANTHNLLLMQQLVVLLFLEMPQLLQGFLVLNVGLNFSIHRTSISSSIIM